MEGSPLWRPLLILIGGATMKDEKIIRINFLQRKILLNSMMYYQHDKNFISDFHYDECCKELVKLQKAYGPDFIDDSMYGYVFYDFDGSTGYHLYYRLTEKDKYWLGLINQQKLDRDRQDRKGR